MIGNTPSYRQQVLEAIEKCLGDQALWAGMALWDQHYANQPNPSIKAFSQQLCDQLQRPDALNSLYTTLLNHFFLHRNRQCNMPPQMASSPTMSAQIAPVKPSLPATAVIFSQLVTEFFKQLGFIPENRNGNHVFIQPQLRTLVHSLPLEMEQRELCNKVMLKGELEALHNVMQTTLIELFHKLYIATVEQMGPIETDQALGNAITQLEHTPAGRQFNPRNFL